MSTVFFGTADLSKPRTRIILGALKQVDELHIVHHAVWHGRDKSQYGWLHWLLIALRMLIAYPVLIVRYAFAPKHTQVVIGYPMLLDGLVLWPMAQLRGVRVIGDCFFSLYDTLVNDRKLFSERHLLMRALFQLERLSLRCCDVIVADTEAHADYLAELFTLPRERFQLAFVGAEAGCFYPYKQSKAKKAPVLFYGQFSPLHGIDVILDAAEKLPDVPFKIIGSGQLYEEYKDRLSANNITYQPWVSYGELVHEINRARVCLGVFGSSEKARSVVPNKVYQSLACGTAVITMASNALSGLEGVTEVDPRADDLANALTVGQKAFKPEDFSAIIVKQWQSIINSFSPAD